MYWGVLTQNIKVFFVVGWTPHSPPPFPLSHTKEDKEEKEEKIFLWTGLGMCISRRMCFRIMAGRRKYTTCLKKCLNQLLHARSTWNLVKYTTLYPFKWDQMLCKIQYSSKLHKSVSIFGRGGGQPYLYRFHGASKNCVFVIKCLKRGTSLCPLSLKSQEQQQQLSNLRFDFK